MRTTFVHTNFLRTYEMVVATPFGDASVPTRSTEKDRVLFPRENFFCAGIKEQITES